MTSFTVSSGRYIRAIGDLLRAAFPIDGENSFPELLEKLDRVEVAGDNGSGSAGTPIGRAGGPTVEGEA